MGRIASPASGRRLDPVESWMNYIIHLRMHSLMYAQQPRRAYGRVPAPSAAAGRGAVESPRGARSVDYSDGTSN